jgi:hypothetical protein
MSDHYPAEVHDALRSQGLVPQSEDVHFGACSTDYRVKMIQAFGDQYSPATLSAALHHAEESAEYECERADNAEYDLRSANKDVERLEKELAQLQKTQGAAE